MYHHNIRKIITHTAAGILLSFGMLLSSTAWSNGCLHNCVRVEGGANIQFVGPLIPGPDPIARGTVTYQFPDAVRQAMVTAYLLEPAKYADDGRIHLIIEVQHDFPNGDNLTWRLNMVLSPTDVPGEYLFRERNRLTSGAGIFADAFGRSRGHGTASFNTGQAQVSAKGKICGVEE